MTALAMISVIPALMVAFRVGRQLVVIAELTVERVAAAVEQLLPDAAPFVPLLRALRRCKP